MVVDYRYLSGSLVDLVKDNNIQDVIYVNNANALIESAVKNMKSYYQLNRFNQIGCQIRY